jgi:putative MATE family efflux protein
MPDSTPTNPLSTDNIYRLFAKIALPITFGMLISGLYNIVDAYFIARYVGENAFAAVSAVFPMQMLLIALTALIGNGVSIAISQYWGANNDSATKTVLNNAMSMLLIIWLVITLLTYVYEHTILTSIGITPMLFTDASTYFLPIMLGSIFLFSLSLICDVLRAQTNMTGLFLIILLGSIMNIVLDFLFVAIFNLGVFGAAIATLIGQCFGIIIGLKLLQNGRYGFRLSSLQFELKLKVIKHFLSLGLPVFIAYIGASLIMMIINVAITQQAGGNRELALAAYGIIGRINIFIILPLIAISQAVQTIIAHNFGANKHHRVQEAVLAGLFIATSYLVVMTIILYLLPQQIFALFSNSSQLIQQATAIANTMFLALPLVGFSIVSTAYFQAIGKAKIAMLISSVKVYLLLIPIIIGLTKYSEVHTMWYAFPATEVIASLFLLLLIRTFMSKQNKLNNKLTMENAS